jgi:DNA-binding transcriptional LysR family regulator
VKDINNLSLREIKLLADLPKMRSIRSFSLELGVSPAALSKTIMKLEQILDVTMFDRSAVGVIPTPELKELSLWARDVMTKIEVISRPKEQTDLPSFKQQITIGTRAFLNNLFCGSFIKSSAQDEIGWRFIDLSPHETLEAARLGGIQISLSLGKLPLGESWYQEKVGTLEWALYVRHGHPLPPNPAKEDLTHYYFTYATYWDGTSVIKGEDFIPLEKKMKHFGYGMQTAQTAIEIAKASDHIIHAPKLLARSHVASEELREVQLKGIKFTAHELYLATQIDKIPKKLQTSLVKQLEKRISGQIL